MFVRAERTTKPILLFVAFDYPYSFKLGLIFSEEKSLNRISQDYVYGKSD